MNLHEHAPAYFAWSTAGSTGAMLYVTEDEKGSSSTYPAIAGAFAPAQETLASPNGYATSP